jgi:hypothetical protein
MDAVFFGCVLRGVIVVPMDDTGNRLRNARQQVEAKLMVGSTSICMIARPRFSIATLIRQSFDTINAPSDKPQISLSAATTYCRFHLRHHRRT